MKLSKKGLAWIAVSIALLAIIVFVSTQNQTETTLEPTSQSQTQIPAGEVKGAATPEINQNQQAKPSNTSITAPAAPNGYYENTYGNEVPRPYVAPSKPANASAQCADGTYSFSQSRRGTCSHHGGVAEWF